MTVLEKKLQELKSKGRLGLMTHVVVGYPTLRNTVSLVKLMAKEGVDIIELQIPFSDPLADGPTIIKACEESLQNGTTVADAFALAHEVSQLVSTPLLFMAYFNTVFTYGVEKFCKNAEKAGISGLIIPDVPLEEEEHEHLSKFCKKYNLSLIQVVSPVSTQERLQKNARVAQGFVYATSRQGITGVRNELPSNMISYLKKIRKYFSVPIAVGFGISKKEHIKSISSYADIVIVGSAIIDVINTSKSQDIERNVASFIKHLKMVN